MREGCFESVEQMVAAMTPADPVLCLRRGEIQVAAAAFTTFFPGKVLYAVKANNHPLVLGTLWDCGVRDFDTASLAEIQQLRALLPRARCNFNHPVKSREAIRAAHRDHGVRDFVVDSGSELEKLLSEAGDDLTVQVRLKVRSAHALYDFSSKFGAEVSEAVVLLRTIADSGLAPAISFHVGSQCLSPAAFTSALSEVARTLAEAEVRAAYVNVGGGFPAMYRGSAVPSLCEYFGAIAAATASHAVLRDVPLQCEPGRSLLARSGTLVTKVLLRRGAALYLNDGVYGCMGEVNHIKLTPPVRLVRPGGQASCALETFRIFGPTCDSFDALDASFELPADTREGDWIAIGELGAYSNVLANRFNGFRSESVVEVVW